MGADLNASDAFIRRLPRKYFIWLLAVEDLCESLLIDVRLHLPLIALLCAKCK